MARAKGAAHSEAMKPVVQGIAKTAPQANAVIEELRARGFLDSEIAMLFPDRQEPDVTGVAEGTKAPAAAAAGGMAGLGVGGAFGLLAGFGALAIPGIGPLVAAGPLMAALSAATVGGATGGIIGGLLGLGRPEPRSKRHTRKTRVGKAGNILILVHSDDRKARSCARKILEQARTRAMDPVRGAN